MALERDIVPGPTKNVISLPPPNFHVTGGNMALVSGKISNLLRLNYWQFPLITLFCARMGRFGIWCS